ncbi:MAG: DUF2142 domain-containing protein [Lewinella sp.]|nr:DUF2142 domain-containing protein [Lewinella sp.]
MYLPGYIGTLGWLDTQLPTALVALAYLGLLALALVSGLRLPPAHRLGLLLTFLLCYALVVFSQLLSWESVGSTSVGTLQGRYLTPFCTPALFLAFSGLGRPWLRLQALGICVLLGSGGLLWAAAAVHQERYYKVPNSAQFTEVNCGAEQTVGLFYRSEEGNWLLDNDPNGQQQQHVRTGRAAAQVGQAGPSTNMTLHLFDCRAGDTLVASVWRYGSPHAGLVVSSREVEEFDVYNFTVKQYDAKGWAQLTLDTILPPSFQPGKSLAIFVISDQAQTSYFDDFRVEYRRRQ